MTYHCSGYVTIFVEMDVDTNGKERAEELFLKQCANEYGYTDINGIDIEEI